MAFQSGELELLACPLEADVDAILSTSFSFLWLELSEGEAGEESISSSGLLPYFELIALSLSDLDRELAFPLPKT